jgi:hypothetical protein
MSTLKEFRQGTDKWVRSTDLREKAINVPTKEEKFACSDVKGEYDPEDYVSLTVPGESKSIKELMDRYEKGRPLPTVQ